MRKKLTILTILAILSQVTLSQDIALVPEPVAIEKGTGGFTISSETKIVLGNDVPEYLGNYLSEILSSSSAKGSKPERSEKARMRAVNLLLDGKREDIGDEGYRFVSAKKGITISAASPGGLFYGIQTMRQLMKQNSKGFTVTAVSVTDYPRFRWRGYLLDPARHFRTKDEIKRYIDLIALCELKCRVTAWLQLRSTRISDVKGSRHRNSVCRRKIPVSSAEMSSRRSYLCSVPHTYMWEQTKYSQTGGGHARRAAAE
jgi:hexosaminidase